MAAWLVHNAGKWGLNPDGYGGLARKYARQSRDLANSVKVSGILANSFLVEADILMI